MSLMDLLKISLSGPSTGSIVAVDDPPALNMAAIDDLPGDLIETLAHVICIGIMCIGIMCIGIMYIYSNCPWKSFRQS